MSSLPGSSALPGCPSAVLTHHWLVRRRGGEKVLEALAEILPKAEIHTLLYDPDGLGDSPLNQRRIHTSFLQAIPGATRHHPRLLPFLTTAARSIRLPPSDLVVCSDAALAKVMRPHAESTFVVYCHSPMRYAYEPALYEAYRKSLPAPLRPLFAASLSRARKADRRAARRVDLFIANSATVAGRIERAYGREARVVHPPVEVPQEPVTSPREDFYLCVGYHAPYKRLDLAVEACRKLGRKLVVIGTGPGVDSLREDGSAHVDLLGWQSDEIVADHYRRARGLLFCGEEDFGIVPVEAYAHGCPVIAYGRGGATESVDAGLCGLWFDEQRVEDVADAITRAEATTFDPLRMHQRARHFRPERFLAEMRDLLGRALEDRRKT
jgi:glycosyltransferase involved in cell wall biosynthesis